MVSILNDHSDMKKLSAQWVFRSKRNKIDHNSNHVGTWKDYLTLVNNNPEEFFCSFITMEEIWIHQVAVGPMRFPFCELAPKK